jgi:chlorinating enzyme
MKRYFFLISGSMIHISTSFIPDVSCESKDELAINFWDNGVVGPLTILSDDEAAQVQKEFEEWINSLQHLKTSSGNEESTTKLQIYCSGNLRFKPHLHLSFANRLVRHPTLVDSVQRALGSRDIFCWSSDFNIKDPQTEGCFAPHQDATYAGLFPADQVITAWVALSDRVGMQDGGLVFWKGSHKSGQIPHQSSCPTEGSENHQVTATANLNPYPHNLLARGQYCDVPRESAEPVSFELRRGQATLHHFYCVHASGPNVSCKPRIGLAIRYMTAQVRRKTGRFRESITWISGNKTDICDDDNGGFDLEPILPEHPTHVDIEAGLRAHAVAVEREAANYFETSHSIKEYN